MAALELVLSATTRVVEGVRQSIVLDRASRKWVKLPTPALAALRRLLGGDGAACAPPPCDVSPRQMENTVRCLREHGFLVEPAPPAGAPETTPGPARAAPTKRTLHLHVTQRCNLACATCYVADYLRHGPDPLTLEDLRCILGTAAAVGYGVLNVSGGEPLLREDLFEVLGAARGLFGRVILTTNGVALDEGVGRRLAPLVDSLIVSLDGATAEVNDEVRGKGSFERTLRGLRALSAAGFPMLRVAISPTVTRVNHEHLEDVVDLAARLGARAFFGFFMPTGRGLCNRERLTLGCADMLALFERAAARRVCQLGLAAAPEPAAGMDAVRTDCRIDGILTVQADGSIVPCPNLNQREHCLGNYFELTRQEFEATLRGCAAKDRYVRRSVDAVPGCAACECRYFCGGGCMANAYMSTGDMESSPSLRELRFTCRQCSERPPLCRHPFG